MKKKADITLKGCSKIFLAASLLFAFLLLYKDAKEPGMDARELFFLSAACLTFLIYYFAVLLLSFRRKPPKKPSKS